MPLRFLLVLFVTAVAAHAAADPAAVVPPTAPRTLVVSGRHAAFREYCTTGDGAAAFNRIRTDLDTEYLDYPFPAEPVTYGDPAPSKRDSLKADRWRDVQDLTGRITAIAEAATLAWLVTGEQRYLDKARDFLLHACTWTLDPDWRQGPVPGATDIHYNDEGAFRLWRKLPLIYDQLRNQLTPEQRQQVLDHFRARGRQTVEWIRASGIEQVRRNSLEVEPSSHPIRFMAMVGLSALALWDDLPETRDWWDFAYSFYRDQFSPFGGDAGGWAEGSAYWRGTIEHAAFQDALLAIGDPLAYASPFWRNSPYFAVYNVQPYLHTIFGDASNAGHFNLEPVMAEYLLHLARVQQDGFLVSYARLLDDPRPRPADAGMGKADRNYPTAAELLIRNFIGSRFPLPEPRNLGDLPPYRLFEDVGWVSFHSALGRPSEDIHVTFKSSPFGSFSHSHADQNAFILNAYGEGLAINSANREFHNSPHHDRWTRQTRSKNALLLDGRGQRPKDKRATGRITRFETGPRYAWATGDATTAYQTEQPEGRVQRVTRDLVFVDQRYVVTRDRVELADPGRLSWLLHAEFEMSWASARSQAVITGERATLTAQLVAPGLTWRADITDRYPAPIDPRYRRGETYTWVTAEWRDHVHLRAEPEEQRRSYTVFAVLWPERGGRPDRPLAASLEADGTLRVQRPDGKVDRISLTDTTLRIEPGA